MSKSCPNPTCSFKYTRRVQPNVCPECGALIGNLDHNDETKLKNNANSKSIVIRHPTVYLGEGIFSVNYWQLNRCLGKNIYKSY